ncbi:aldo/keto reductase [Alphaproteobacteria bacterium GH1-50]|uniref:Aldo/keto reductase n=1 Tax=Kangsaoukella pontilimi TaxID=2691042 RepID=A0A7C9IQT8_9RHOB|nr:aldo/keto reductase [Kangsaoukella pontilimi]MXQ06325.1 aldo/keto reductase [Kangsaoukella pontilimi]
MKRTTLGRTGIEVSEYCLGTMTWGTQTPEDDAHAQIERSYDAGIDFMDTAEMYPVNPVLAETVGNTETIIGNWVAKSGRRKDWIIATKHSGKNGGFVRDGRGIHPDTIRGAVEGSLKRLQTDYIDVYQFHWPNRGSYHFRQNWDFDPSGQPSKGEIVDEMHGVMQALKEMVDEGKIRAFGLSNDSAWGTMQWLGAAAKTGGPRVATMQNEYSLLCRHYDTDMAELAVHEDVTLLAFSPLAAGFLTGKYQNDNIPEGSRMSLNAEMGGRKSARVFDATAAYLDIARRHGLDPVHLALQWTRTRPFPTIPIFGATTMDQLEITLKAPEVTLTEEVLDEVSKAHRAHPIPY